MLNKLAELQLVKEMLAAEYLEKQAALDELIKIAAPLGFLGKSNRFLKNLLFAEKPFRGAVNPNWSTLWGSATPWQKARAIGMGTAMVGVPTSLGYQVYDALRPKPWHERLYNAIFD